MYPNHSFLSSAAEFQWGNTPAFDNIFQQGDANFAIPQLSQQSAVASSSTSSVPIRQDEAPNEPAVVLPDQNQHRTIEGEHHRSRYRDLNWDMHKEVMRRLYLKENKTLKEVREYMAQQGFVTRS